MSRHVTIAEKPPTFEELAVVAATRMFGLDCDEAIGRLAVPVERDEEGYWRRGPRPIPPYLKLFTG